MAKFVYHSFTDFATEFDHVCFNRLAELEVCLSDFTSYCLLLNCHLVFLQSILVAVTSISAQHCR